MQARPISPCHGWLVLILPPPHSEQIYGDCKHCPLECFVPEGGESSVEILNLDRDTHFTEIRDCPCLRATSQTGRIYRGSTMLRCLKSNSGSWYCKMSANRLLAEETINTHSTLLKQTLISSRNMLYFSIKTSVSCLLL